MTMTPKDPHGALRDLISTAIISVVVGRWLWGTYAGPELGVLWELMMLVLTLAAAIGLFGRRAVLKAVDLAQDMRQGRPREEIGDE